VVVLVLGGCAQCAGPTVAPAVRGDGGSASRGPLTTTTTAARAALSCKTSRFPWARTPSVARPHADDEHDHDHGKTELILPLVLGRSRCPSRGHLLVRVWTPADGRARDVEVEGLGQRLREVVAAGREVTLAGELTLEGRGLGAHPLVVRVDGRAVTVPAVEITP
jgi:hypothetical protein